MIFSKWFKPKAVKKIAFLDGDQGLPQIIEAYEKYLIGTETHLVRAFSENIAAGNKEPKILRKLENVNKIYLSGYTARKEIVDKFIGAYIQKAIQNGYKHITVVSSDYDFIDIFKMAVILNPEMTDLTFRIIVPNGKGKMSNLPDQIANIEVVQN